MSTVKTKKIFIKKKGGDVHGIIKITMDYTIERFERYNPSSHERDPWSCSVHKIECFIGDEIVYEMKKITTHDILLSEIEIAERELRKEMKRGGSNDHQASIAMKLDSLGYE